MAFLHWQAVFGIHSAFQWEMTIAMERMISYLPIALAAILSTHSVSADRGTIRADGFFVVLGATIDAALIRVVPSGAAAYSLPMGTSRFVLELPLDDTYLVSFERPGCPTKEIHLDTSVPADRMNQEFTFRFKVTLESMDEDRMFTYDGPVGSVRYMQEFNDFGYETQYLVKVNKDLKERMKRYRINGLDPKVIVAPTAALVNDGPRGAVAPTNYDPEAIAVNKEVAPIVREVPRMVHRLGTSDDLSKETAVDRASLERGALLPISIIDVLKELPLEPAILNIPKVGTVKPKKEVSDKRTTSRTVEVVGPSIHREEELTVEPRRICTVVRLIHEDGRVDELRKVIHSYGATFFFHNGQSITSDRYLDLSAQR